jgi:FtsX-like permease family
MHATRCASWAGIRFHGGLDLVVTPGFMRALGIRLRGRDFSWFDDRNSPRVVMINESAARFYWPGEDAVGKVLASGKQELMVAAVVDDVHEDSPEGEPGWQIYYPSTQQSPNGAQLVVRSGLRPAVIAGGALRALRELNPQQPVAEFRPIRTIVDRAGSPRRFFMLLVAAFAGLGILLASLGIYGVISYSVTRQKQETGVRMALGASTARVQRDVLVESLRLTLLGVAVGTVASMVSAHLISSLLFATSPWDAGTYATMMLALVAVALLAGYLPALRASRINPIVALRRQ